MKRRTATGDGAAEPQSESERQKRRRQPQYSCDFCRSKKLRCSGHPCSSCVSRGLQCTGGGDGGGGEGNHSWSSRGQGLESVDSQTVPSILARLQTLEHAIFGAPAAAPTTAPVAAVVTGTSSSQGGGHGLAYASPAVATPTSSRLNPEGQLTAQLLDSAHTQGARSLPITPQPGLTDNPDTLACIIADGTLMTRELALTLLQVFVNNPYHLLVVIHEPSVRDVIETFYTHLDAIRHENSACEGARLNPWHAALILSISAISATLFNKGMLGLSESSFTSADEAAQSSFKWGRAAQRILDAAHETSVPGSASLEEVQARAIIAYLVYNQEGYSARFRFLHSCSVAAAREASLHIVERSRVTAEEHGQASAAAVIRREVKRRLWWHIAASDWMCGVMGGPFDGSYTIHPRHMCVRLPRNLNDNDLSNISGGEDADTITFPINVPTQLSCFLQRIRLAEICRSIIDAHELARSNEDVLSCARVLELDRLFQRALDEFPPFMRLDAPIPADAPRYLSLQRAIINIAFHSRRARLHRPFVFNNLQPCAVENIQYSGRRQQQQHLQCRDTCLRSARAVVSIVVALFDTSLAAVSSDQNTAKGKTKARSVSSSSSREPLAHRLAIFISHLFMACTVLACSLHALKSGDTIADHELPAPDMAAEPVRESDVREDLARACRVLEAAGQESPVAARLVYALTDSLRPSRDRNVTPGHDSGAQYPPTSQFQAQKHDKQTFGDPVVSQEEVNLQPQEHGATPADSGADYGLGLDVLWSDFPDMLLSGDGWDEFFTNTESFLGPT